MGPGGRGSLLVSALAVAAAAGITQPAGASWTAPARAVPRLPPAPDWVSSSPWAPQRPASCGPLDGDPNVATSGQLPQATGTFPWPAKPASVADPKDFSAYDHTASGFPPVRPANWSAGGGDWKLTSARTAVPVVNDNPQELCGVEGGSVDRAWQVTTGRPTTVIAVLDSGIEWCDPAVVDKVALNAGALPLPEDAHGLSKPALRAMGRRFADADPWDLDGSGVLNAAQYASDPRVLAVARVYGGLFCATANGPYPAQPDLVSPMDLIRAFGTPTLPGPGGSSLPNPWYRPRQSPAGFTEAIAGWNFVDNDNDPYDSVHFDHGTGEAQDSSGAANTLAQEVGACPNCMVLPVRVGDSFITSGNLFAEGVLFAVDSGASVVQEALGTYDDTEVATQAVGYAEAHGVPVVASAADEEAEHHNLPALLDHTIVVNSVTRDTSFSPPSYLYLNGCTNYGANIAVSVESSSCSSEATGKAAGVAGLIESAAQDAVAAGRLRPYPGLRSATGRPVALSVDELRQLMTMSASPVDFATPAPPNGPADNYAVSAPGVPLATTTRFPSHAGLNPYFGWGRLDAARALGWVAQAKVPPEAEIDAPSWFQVLAPGQHLAVSGTVGTRRGESWRYQVDVAVGDAPLPGDWHLVACGQGQGVRRGLLARVSLQQVARLFPPGSSFNGGPVGPGGAPEPDRFSFSVRVVAQATSGPSQGMVGVDQRAEFLHADPGLLPGFPKRLGESLDAPATLAPLGPGGTNVLLVASAGGTIHALEPDGHELAGWPVRTAPLDYHRGEEAFASGQVSAVPRGEVVGGVAVGDLRRADGGDPDVVACDLSGACYAWDRSGRLLPGFPVRTNPMFSGPQVANAQNRVLPGVFAAPALADLSGRGQLDVVAAAMDRHVYVWGPNGAPVPGWPVLVVDYSKVASVDPRTDQVGFSATAGAEQGTKLMDTPAVGDLSGRGGRPDLVVGSNEEYAGPPDADLGSGLLATFLALSGQLAHSANGRLYAVYPDGRLHGPSPSAAFLPGWPAALVDFVPGLLPNVGDGVVASPALAPGPGGAPVVAAMSTAGPAYLLDPQGSSALGTGPSGLPRVMGSGEPGPLASSTGPLATSVPALGDPVLAPLGPAGLALVAPAASLGRLLDQSEPADQVPHDAQVDAWDAATGGFEPGFPQVAGDLEFLAQPIVARVAGPARGPYVVAASATYDLRALDAEGREAPGFPKFTGGWAVNSASQGRFGALPDQVLALGTREGYLFVWRTPTPACSSPGPWPRQHHDLWNTSDLAGGPPGRPCRPPR
jgi:hypothetical protein